MHPQTHIEICPQCKGEEKIRKMINQEDFEMITCPTCEGSGRVKVTIEKTIKPFKPKN